MDVEGEAQLFQNLLISKTLCSGTVGKEFKQPHVDRDRLLKTVKTSQ